jgi:hypothetical protein
VPKQAFLGLVEGFLNEDHRLYLWVEELTEKKEFGCDHCSGTITVWSPDDAHTVLLLEKIEGSIERKYKCKNPKCGKENIRFWKQTGFRPVIRSG